MAESQVTTTPAIIPPTIPHPLPQNTTAQDAAVPILIIGGVLVVALVLLFIIVIAGFLFLKKKHKR